MNKDKLDLVKVTSAEFSWCQINGCKKEAQYTIRVCDFSFHFCPQHMEQFIEQLNDETKKVKEFNKCMEQKRKEIFEKE